MRLFTSYQKGDLFPLPTYCYVANFASHCTDTTKPLEEALGSATLAAAMKQACD